MTRAVADEFGLPLTTTAAAAARYRAGTRRLLSGSDAALAAFDGAALEDPEFALAYAGGAAACATTGASGRGRLEARLEAARRTARRASRRERQHVEVVTAALDGDVARAVALSADHLTEFPGDVVVLHVLAAAVRHSRDDRLHEQLRPVLGKLPALAARPSAEG